MAVHAADVLENAAVHSTLEKPSRNSKKENKRLHEEKANLLEIEALPGRVRDLILKKAEGNPFFMEEVIRMLIERLSRKWLGLNYGRTDDQPTPTRTAFFIGPQISILNENSASDGDIFPAMFREPASGRSWAGGHGAGL
jgi:hypothetical protein